MSVTDKTRLPRLIAAEIHDAAELLSREPPVWPDATAIDASGAQLLAAAMKSGLALPDELLDRDDLRQLWSALALDTVLPLPAPTARASVPSETAPA